MDVVLVLGDDECKFHILYTDNNGKYCTDILNSKIRANVISNTTLNLGNIIRKLSKRANYPNIHSVKYIKDNSRWNNEINNVVFKISCNGTAYNLHPVQLVAMHFQELIKSNKCIPNLITFAHPHFYVEWEKQALRDAANISGISNIRFIENVIPMCESFRRAFYSKGWLSSKTERIIFIELKNEHTIVNLCNMNESDAEILATASDPNLGSNEFDGLLFENMLEQIKDMYGTQAISFTNARKTFWETFTQLKSSISDKSTKIRVEDSTLPFKTKTGLYLDTGMLKISIITTLEKLVRMIVQVIFMNEIGKLSIDWIAYYGEEFQIPVLKEYLQKKFKCRNIAQFHEEDIATEVFSMDKRKDDFVVRLQKCRKLSVVRVALDGTEEEYLPLEPTGGCECKDCNKGIAGRAKNKEFGRPRTNETHYNARVSSTDRKGNSNSKPLHSDGIGMDSRCISTNEVHDRVQLSYTEKMSDYFSKPLTSDEMREYKNFHLFIQREKYIEKEIKQVNAAIKNLEDENAAMEQWLSVSLDAKNSSTDEDIYEKIKRIKTFQIDELENIGRYKHESSKSVIKSLLQNLWSKISNHLMTIKQKIDVEATLDHLNNIAIDEFPRCIVEIKVKMAVAYAQSIIDFRKQKFEGYRSFLNNHQKHPDEESQNQYFTRLRDIRKSLQSSTKSYPAEEKIDEELLLSLMNKKHKEKFEKDLRYSFTNDMNFEQEVPTLLKELTTCLEKYFNDCYDSDDNRQILENIYTVKSILSTNLRLCSRFIKKAKKWKNIDETFQKQKKAYDDLLNDIEHIIDGEVSQIDRQKLINILNPEDNTALGKLYRIRSNIEFDMELLKIRDSAFHTDGVLIAGLGDLQIFVEDTDQFEQFLNQLNSDFENRDKIHTLLTSH